jgi:hypothetical protein
MKAKLTMLKENNKYLKAVFAKERNELQELKKENEQLQLGRAACAEISEICRS